MAPTSDPSSESSANKVPKITPPKIDVSGHWRKLNLAHFWSHVGTAWSSTFFDPKDPSGKRKDFRGKTVVMIGATSNISAEATIKIARLNASNLILGVGNIREGNILRDRIHQEAKRNDTSPFHVMVFALDMTSFSSIENFVNDIQKVAAKIHAVVLDVNVQRHVRDEYGHVARSTHGTELQLQVNVISTAYLSIFLLALLLETSLQDNVYTHLEFVCCENYDVNQDFRSLRRRPEYSILQHLNKYPEDAVQFPATKFLQMGLMVQLAKRVNQGNVLVFDAEPGQCQKPRGHRALGLSQCKQLGKCVFARTAEQGSRILVSGLLRKPRTKFYQWKLHGLVWKDDRVEEPQKFQFSREYEVLTDAVFLELLQRFRNMRNFRAIKRIVPDGGRPIDADRIKHFRIWYRGEHKYLSLSTDDDKSFWGNALIGVISDRGDEDNGDHDGDPSSSTEKTNKESIEAWLNGQWEALPPMTPEGDEENEEIVESPAQTSQTRGRIMRRLCKVCRGESKGKARQKEESMPESPAPSAPPSPPASGYFAPKGRG